MTEAIFDTEVIRLGSCAKEMLDENMIVLFGKEVPELVEDVSFIHSSNCLKAEPKKGDVLAIGETSFEIDDVGKLVYKNLSELGHCTIQFIKDESEEAILPGTILVRTDELPEIDVQTQVKIFKRG